MSYVGPSFGASWGDFNGDGRPDVWIGSHSSWPRLYIGNSQGGFDPVAVPFVFGGDNHGAAWADFDNDGDQDLLVLNGAQYGTGIGPNRLMVNNGGQMEERAAEFGLDYIWGSGRTPLWFDWNNDGLLDVFLANYFRADGAAPSALFTNTGSAFVLANESAGISVSSGNHSTDGNYFAQLGWHGATKKPLLLLHRRLYPEFAMRYDSVPFVDISAELGFPEIHKVKDVAHRDFDGDDREDFFLTQVNNPRGSELRNGVLRGVLMNGAYGEVGVRFQGGGGYVDFEFFGKARPDNIFIGSNGINPAARNFQLDITDIANHGIKPHSVGDEFAIYVGFDSSSGDWEIFVSHDTGFSVNYVVTGAQQISSAEDVNMVASDGTKAFSLLRADDVLTDITNFANFGVPSACESVVAADFDNDMDIDIYLACRGIVWERLKQAFPEQRRCNVRRGAGGRAARTEAMSVWARAPRSSITTWMDSWISS